MMTNDLMQKYTTFARKAKDAYYPSLDASPEKRAELGARYYPGQQSHALMNWNGHICNTVEEVQNYLATLPKTKHHIQSADTQPLPRPDGQVAFMVTVNGTVVYDDEHTKTFFQRLVFCEKDSHWFIIQDYYRWTGEKA